MTTGLADRIVGHYQRHAHAWDADRQAGGWVEKPWHDRFVAAVRPGGSVLDLGCGSGAPVACNMVRCGLRVTGVDTSPALIALCRERMPGETWTVADMRGLSLGRVFDGVVAWDSFFHLCPADQRATIPVFARHAAPGAALLFNTGPAEGEAVGCYRGDELFHASLGAAEYRALLTEAGLAVVAHVAEDPAAGGRTVWLCRARQ